MNYKEGFDNAVKQIEDIGVKYATAKALSWKMQEMRKVVLAQMMKKQEGSVASREMNARASNEYIIHLNGTETAIENENKLKAQYERYKAEYEKVRSLCSLEKAKINII